MYTFLSRSLSLYRYTGGFAVALMLKDMKLGKAINQREHLYSNDCMLHMGYVIVNVGRDACRNANTPSPLSQEALKLYEHILNTKVRHHFHKYASTLNVDLLQ